MRRWLVWVLAAVSVVSVAGCGGGRPGATPTALTLVPGTSPLVTAAPLAETAGAPTEASPATAPPAATSTAAPEVTAATDPAVATVETAGSAVSGDPLLRTYRSLVAIQMNAALAGETVAQVQAGRIDQEEMPVAALALGALTQSVDEALPGVTPPPALAAQWEEVVALHQAVKSLGARWLIGQLSVAEVAAALAPMREDLERLVAEGDAAVAAQYGVSAAELTEHRVRLVEAVGGVFE